MKEFKELPQYKNRGNSYLNIPIKPVVNVDEYKLPNEFIPNEPCAVAPSHLHSYLKWEYVGMCKTGRWHIIHDIKIPRNSLCPCNSGKKYKKCCLT